MTRHSILRIMKELEHALSWLNPPNSDVWKDERTAKAKERLIKAKEMIEEILKDA